MDNFIYSQENRDNQHENLIRQNQSALANLMASLNSNQHQLLNKYIKTSDALHRHELVNLALLLKQNKKG